MANENKAPSRRTTVSQGQASSRNGLIPKGIVEIQRARILAAMAEVSRERGVANATVAHVVERAGVSRRTFYELYDDREDCLLAAFEEGIARVTRQIFEVYDQSGSWLLRTRSALASLLEFLEFEEDMGRLLVVGSLEGGDRVSASRRLVFARLVAHVEEGCRDGGQGARPLPLAAEGVVGGAISVLHARISEGAPLAELLGPLMSMIVLPYLGVAAARKELARPVSASSRQRSPAAVADPLRGMPMRLTYRTVRVLSTLARHPDTSNREVGIASGMRDQGQISKLLTRLSKLGLIENGPEGRARGAPNAWRLTAKGHELERAVGEGLPG